jgi:hypothetical protein
MISEGESGEGGGMMSGDADYGGMKTSAQNCEIEYRFVIR